MRYFKIILTVMVLFFCSGNSWAQSGVGIFHSETISIQIGPFNGVDYVQTNENVLADEGYRKTVNSYQQIIEHISSINAASWIRLKFNNVNLGDNSYITIISDQDGGVQKLTGQTMEIWNNGSAMFNGNGVTLTLHVASTDNSVGLSVAELVVGDADPNGPTPESQCGPTDNRVNSATGAIGRVSPVGCTGWLIANGSFLTAGHCTGLSMDIIEFNVPASTSNGFTVASAPNNQYPIGSVVFQEVVGTGNDWAVFSVGVNSNTGLTPNEAQGSFNIFDQRFFRATKDNSAATNRITGFGIDFVPPGSGGNGNRNSDSQTQQTSTGGVYSETGSGTAVGINYQVDSEGGNSGGPVIMNGTINTVGIHTNAGCNTSASPGTNAGTGFEEDDLETAIDAFNGSTDLYVDEGYPSAVASGSVMRPFKTVNSAITAAAAGTTLYIAEGGYPETVITSKNLIFKAPVGMIVIGPNAPAAPNAPVIAEARFEAPTDQKAVKSATWTTYPNPFISRIHIKNEVFENGNVEINLYNLLSQKVAVLANYQNLEGQMYYENFDLSYLPKGIYTLVINHNGKQSVSKITKAN